MKEPETSGAVTMNLKRARAAAEEYARQVRARFGKRTSRITLYGSAARGDWTDESDIDVLILLDREEPGDMEWLVNTAYAVGISQRHLLLQPVMLTADEFKHLVDRERRFATDVLNEGIMI